MTLRTRPDPTEYHPYYETYIALVGPGLVLDILEANARHTQEVLARVPEDRADHTYAPGKWTVRQVVAHMIDTERVFAARALRGARGDTTPLPGFDQDIWMGNLDVAHLPLAALAAEFIAVRTSSLLLFRHLPEAAWTRMANANGADVTVRALAYMIAGHELHHLGVLARQYNVT